MAGWGGLILTGGGNYSAERQQASDNYFAMMNQSLSSLSNCTGSAGTTGAAPTAAPTVSTPPTTPTIPAGGSGGCLGTRTTSDWQLKVVAPGFSSDLFDIVVTPLSDEATDSTFKVRVYKPNLSSSDSSTKFPSFVGQNIRLSYGFDFFVNAPYPNGLYQVELRVDFLKETSLLVICG